MDLEDIKILRQYFLTNSEEIKRNLRSIAPGMLLKYVSILHDGFLKNQNIAITAETIDAKHLLPEIKKLQIDYYYSLASLYNSGGNNEEIKMLLKNNNKIFKTVLEEYESQIFEREIKKAFILNERESVKKKFGDLDKAGDTSSSEIEGAFIQIERKRLKKKFKELDSSEHEETSASVIKLNFKKIAIAASMVGLILLSSILIIIKNKSIIEIAKNDNKKGEVNKGGSNLVENAAKNKATELLADNKLIYNEEQVPVLHEESLGFIATVEKLYIKFYDTKVTIADLEEFNNGFVESNSSNSYEITIKNKIDSLKSLNNKYTFDGKTIAIYMPNTTKVASFKLIDKYFIKIGANVYSIIKSTKLTVLNKVTDNNILEKINKINFQQTN